MHVPDHPSTPRRRPVPHAGRAATTARCPLREAAWHHRAEYDLCDDCHLPRADCACSRHFDPDPLARPR